MLAAIVNGRGLSFSITALNAGIAPAAPIPYAYWNAGPYGCPLARRRLTAVEMARVREWALARERHEYPGARIEILVKDETVQNGDPVYSAVIVRDRIVPSNQVL